MWVRNAWYVAAWCDELPAETLFAATIINQPLVLYRKSDGAVVALEDRCAHRLAPLSKGRCEGDDLRCLYHGMKFASDGRCIEIPGQASIPEKARVRAFPTVERGSWIWIWMGEAELADPALIPQTVSNRDPAWRIKTGRLDYEANYELINDNLLDLTHLAYVHPNTLARGMPAWGEQRPRIHRLERGVRVERWMRNQAAPNHLRRHGETFDFWNTYDFLVPGIFILRSAWHPAGTADRLQDGVPDGAPIFLRCDDQAVTPITDRATRYFYAAGARSHEIEDKLVEKLYAITEQAFHEDKVIIEAQQRVIDLEPERPMLMIAADAGPMQFRRIVESLVARESGGARAAE